MCKCAKGPSVTLMCWQKTIWNQWLQTISILLSI